MRWREKVLELAVYAALAFSLFMAGYLQCLDAVKRGGAEEAAFAAGLTVAASFAAGMLIMYIDKKISFTAVEVYSEKLAEELMRIDRHLDKCARECLCAAEAYVRLFLMGTYVDGIRRSVKS